MFLKMIWRGQHFERTDSEHNFILLSERFNLKRVTLSVQVIASTEPPIGSRNLPNSAVMVSARRQMLKSMRNPETGYRQARTATIVGTLMVQSLLFLMGGRAFSQSSEPHLARRSQWRSKALKRAPPPLRRQPSLFLTRCSVPGRTILNCKLHSRHSALLIRILCKAGPRCFRMSVTTCSSYTPSPARTERATRSLSLITEFTNTSHKGMCIRRFPCRHSLITVERQRRRRWRGPNRKLPCAV